jgi:hypothetical protein
MLGGGGYTVRNGRNASPTRVRVRGGLFGR